MSEKLLRTMATELPSIIRQLQSPDPVLRAAGLQRLEDFSEMTADWRARRLTRRKFLRAGATFAALSFRRDD